MHHLIMIKIWIIHPFPRDFQSPGLEGTPIEFERIEHSIFRLKFQVRKALRTTREFITIDCNTLDLTAGFKMSQKFFRLGSVVYLTHVNGKIINSGFIPVSGALTACFFIG